MLERRLRQVLDNHLPFGGIGLLFIGDFFQLPPIGFSLWKAAMDANSSIGHLMSTFTVFQFNEQMRAQEDIEHTQMLKQFRDLSTSNQPITDSVIRRLRVLSSSDLLEDSTWITSLIVVTNNLERLAIIKEQVIRFGILHRKLVVAWRLELHHTTQRHFQTHSDLNLLYDRFQELSSFFVVGAPAYITENICPLKNLANGTRVTLHSLTLKEEFQDDFTRKYQQTPPGEIIWIDEPPLCVNVELPLHKCFIILESMQMFD